MRENEPAATVDEAPQPTIGVVLADDHAVVRSGLRMLLEAEPDIAVLAEASDVDSAARYVLGHKPQVLVLDLNMGDHSSLPEIPRIVERSPGTAIVVLTMQDDPAYAREALGGGALGYVLKQAADEELIEAVRRDVPQPAPRRQARGSAADLEGRAQRAHRPRGRGPSPDRPRPHQLRHRRSAVPQRAHDRDPSRAHPAEDAPVVAAGASSLRDRQRTPRVAAATAPLP
jgi:DNA-binding NarL/FixJ family response regulator